MDTVSFRDAVKLMKKNDSNPDLIEKLDQLLTFVLLLPVVALGTTHAVGMEALTLLRVKGELTKLGAAIARKVLAEKVSTDPLGRIERLVAAHAILVNVGFFEALGKTLPALEGALGKTIDKIQLRRKLSSADQEDCDVKLTDTPEDIPISLPHPAEGLLPHLARVRQVYSQLSKGISVIITMTEGWGDLSLKAKKTIDELLDSLGDKAIKTYQGRYLQLAANFPELHMWASLDHQAQTSAKLEAISVAIEAALNTKSEAAVIDVGLKRLAKAVAELPRSFDERGRNALAGELQNWYDAVLKRPIIRDKPVSKAGVPDLNFPVLLKGV